MRRGRPADRQADRLRRSCRLSVFTDRAEGQKTGFFLADVQSHLPKYYEAIMDQLWKMEPDLKQGSYKGIEEKAARAKNLFARAIERLKELKRTQG